MNPAPVGDHAMADSNANELEVRHWSIGSSLNANSKQVPRQACEEHMIKAGTDGRGLGRSGCGIIPV